MAADNTNLATAGAIKTYIDGKISSIGTLKGGFNASTETTLPSGSIKGDYWYVTNPGTVQGETFNIGDVLIANVNGASTTNISDWIRLESNRDQATTTILGFVTLATNSEVQTGTDTQKVVTPASLSSRTATETRTGLIEIATLAEANAGVDHTRALTPYTGKAMFDNLIDSKKFSILVGNGSATTYVITHNLGCQYLTPTLVEVSNKRHVGTRFEFTSFNTATVYFTKPVSLNKFYLTLEKNCEEGAPVPE